MATTTKTYVGELTILTCWCDIKFAVPDTMWNRARQGLLALYCPHGHKCTWDAKSDAQLERERASAAERRADQAEATARHQRERAEKAERSAIAYRGHLTRIKKRIVNGVCPVSGCKRTGLVQTMRHIATKHPTWHAEHAHEL